MIHAVDGLVYMDGANLNALVGLVRPGDIGADIVHINLHKTFSTPHGGGGPGSGPVGVKATLVPFLPVPRIVARSERAATGSLRSGRDSIGRLHPFYGNVGIILRAYAYLRSLGPRGAGRRSAAAAIVNANYLAKQVEARLPGGARRARSCTSSSSSLRLDEEARGEEHRRRPSGCSTDGFHAPTVSFPLIVPDCFMIEPTETETRAQPRRLRRQPAEDRGRGAELPAGACTTRRTGRRSAGWTRRARRGR